MEDGPNSNLRTLARHCYNGVCHCDWRLSIEGCEESAALKSVNISLIAVSAFLIATGIPLILYRLFVKGHTLWTPKVSAYGFFSPKPVDCMLVFVLLFNILKLLSAVVLLADLFPTNWIARSYIYELPYDFGLGGITLYLVGISQTISQSHPVAGWLPSPKVVDVIGCAALFLPFIVSIPVSITAGAFAESDLAAAEVMVQVAHIAWFVWTFSIGGGVLYMIFRLVRILSIHHNSRRNRNYAAVKTGIVKIQVIGGTFVVCLWGFATVVLLYIVLRDQIMTNGAVCIFFAAAWSYIGAITSLIAQISAVVSPKRSQNAALQKSISSEDATSDGVTISTRPDYRGVLGQSTADHAAVTFYDESRDEAILDALKIGDMHKEWLLRDNLQWEPSDNDYSVDNQAQNRVSDASHISQLELTTYRQ